MCICIYIYINVQECIYFCVNMSCCPAIVDNLLLICWYVRFTPSDSCLSFSHYMCTWNQCALEFICSLPGTHAPSDYMCAVIDTVLVVAMQSL